MDVLKKFVQKEIILITFLIPMPFLISLTNTPLTILTKLVHWETIMTLTGLFFVTKGIEESNMLEGFIAISVKRFKTERNLALFIVFLTALLSTILTNDIALFIIVPFSLTLFSMVENDLSKLLVLEAIAANAGSVLTPIGNPQNIFLWHKMDISFFEFIKKMLPLFSILILVLIIFTILLFKKKAIVKGKVEPLKKEKDLFYFSLILLVLFITAVQFDRTHIALPIVIVLYLIFFNKVSRRVDYLFIVLFIVVYIDMNLLYTLKGIKNLFSLFNVGNSIQVFIASTLSSQILSNVPATVLMTRFSKLLIPIAYGVNLGGCGIFLSSFANLIVLRLANKKGLLKEFHLISIPFFIICFLVGLFFLF